ncbi:hypothetical protein [Chitinophaga sp.]|uniref:hypothetical protein n=1 Tax=Chitinophaga sp. TaxID=1869181 RepID=UPI0031CEAED4
MADNVGLSLVLQANVQQFNAAINAMEAGSNRANNTMQNLSSTANSFTGSIRNVPSVAAAASAGVNRLGSAAGGGQGALSRLFSAAQQAISSLGGVGSAAQAAGRQMAQSASGANSFSGAIDKVGGLIAGVFAVDKLLDFGKEVLDVTKKYQAFQAVLTNTQGSFQAEKSFELIQEYASKTPYQVDEITGAFIKLVNRGFTPTKTQLTQIGDLAASQGKSFDQLTEAILDAQTGEFERLKEFGIKASQSNDKVTLSFRDQTVSVEKNSKAVRDAVLSFGSLEGVANSTAAVSETLGGQISNLGDSWDHFLNVIGTRTAPALAKALEHLSNFVTKADELLSGVEAKTLEQKVKENENVKNTLDNFAKLTAQQRQEVLNSLERSADQQATTIVKELDPRLARKKELEQLLKDSFAGDKAATEELARINAALPSLLKTRAAYDANQELIKLLRSQDASLKKALPDVGTSFGKSAEKNGKTVADVMKALSADLATINAQNSQFGLAPDAFKSDQVKAYQKAFEDLIKLGLKPTSPEIQKIAKQITSLDDSILGGKAIGTKVLQNLGKSVQTTTVKTLTTDELYKLLGIPNESQLQLDVKIKPKIIFEKSPELNKSFEDAQKEFNDKSAKFAKGITDESAKTLQDIVNALLQDAALSTIEGLGASIGEALVVGGNLIQNAMRSFASVLGGFFQNLGKQLIIYAGVLKGLEIAISNLNPTAAAIAGVAAFVAGGALKAYASKIPSFATGGIVTEPTLAMIGDNPGRKEAVIPSELWPYLGGGNNVTVGGEFILQGNNLVAVVKRASREEGRVR